MVIGHHKGARMRHTITISFEISDLTMFTLQICISWNDPWGSLKSHW